MELIGRQREIDFFNRVYLSKKAEFIAVYGRRRVGKTYMIRQLYQDKWCFSHTGLSPMEKEKNGASLLDIQLQNFASSLRQYGSDIDKTPSNWLEAFDELIELLKRHRKKKRCVVFIDELPWLDTERSSFMMAFEHFWNGWASAQPNIMLITCGSSTSWMEDKLINNKGGLYGRVTGEVHLAPFTLSECEQYYRYRGINMPRYDQLQCYMIFGGIPYYMDRLQSGKSLAENVDAAFFEKRAPLRGEFERLFASLFTNMSDYVKVVRLLATRREGFSRSDIALHTGIPYGGGLTKILKSLIASDFIVDYIHYQGSSRDRRYRLVDNFCLFFTKFVDGVSSMSSSFWRDNQLSPKLNAWRGFAFESVCFGHVDKIKAALGIAGVHTVVTPWHSKMLDDGTQVDMVLDRDDRIVNICEIKYSSTQYVITKMYDRKLQEKVQAFLQETGTKKTAVLTMISTYGLKTNEYSGHIQRSLTMDCLF